jgi:hypothetical protein
MVEIVRLDSPSGSGSVVEHLLAKEGVASSNLVFRSNFFWRRGQVVKAGVCKTPIVGSIPTVASNLSEPAAGGLVSL